MAWEPVGNIQGPPGPPGESGGGGAIVIPNHSSFNRLNLPDYVDMVANPRARLTFITTATQLWTQGTVTLGGEYPFRIYRDAAATTWGDETMVRAEDGGKRSSALNRLFSFTLPIIRTDRFNNVQPPQLTYIGHDTITGEEITYYTTYEVVIEPL